MREDPVLAQILARLSAIEPGQPGPDDPFDRTQAVLDQLKEILDRLEHRLLAESNVPLHQRGFSVMEEPPA